VANLDYPGKPWVKIYSVMENGCRANMCVCIYCTLQVIRVFL
jgi:hypothetical protein